MKKMLVLLPLLVLAGCAPNLNQLSQRGDEGRIQLENKHVFRGELLMVRDSSLLIQLPFVKNARLIEGYDFQVFELALGDIRQLSIGGYANRSWIGITLVPPLLMLAALSSADNDITPGAIVALFAPSLLSAALFESGTTTPQIRAPINGPDIHFLKRHSRFPEGLSQAQLEAYLKSRGIDTVQQWKRKIGEEH